uniref:Histone acetyltransferase n=1 Tax=Rhabditophanes sp. KR3021 TaxID=114890 RepID=A0AC35TLJ5_9BILA
MTLDQVYHLSVFETLSNFYIIGKDITGKKFSVLTIDRSNSNELTISEQESSYNQKEVEELLATISGSSIIVKGRISLMSLGNGAKKGLNEVVGGCFGIIGAVRFLEGYYLNLIIGAKTIAEIGHHIIYKIEETMMLYLPFNRASNSDEQKYLKLFQSVDLTTNFYFSYTYDLSQTLQENTLANGKCNEASELKFFWNNYLLEPLRTRGVNKKWLVNVMHGFICHQTIDFPMEKNTNPFIKVALTLIGRRSSIYAGTRFLKRGANYDGHCANDVETEQILWEITSSSSLRHGNFSSFVQRRSSVPLIWSQDPSTRGVVGKPCIQLAINEPNAMTAALHFKELTEKYGTPVIVMNLVKRHVKNAREKILHTEFLKTVNNLNQFLPKKDKIGYLSFDIAHYHKKASVLYKLEEIGVRVICAQGWFQTNPNLMLNKIFKKNFLDCYTPLLSEDKMYILQKGISRTNCVDCLDRTNVAQFGLAKVALGCQLYSMGFTGDPVVAFGSEFCRIFEEMFDEHGDTMALQYAGSQLVHTIKTYKKISALQEKSRDVIQTISRYYSNTFGDYEKQNSINLFLGIYKPHQMRFLHPPIWDLTSDYMLHFPPRKTNLFNFSEWQTLQKIIPTKLALPTTTDVISLDYFDTYYKVFKLTYFYDIMKQMSTMKIQTLDSFKQDITSSSYFSKLWKNPDTTIGHPDLKRKVSKNNKGTSNEDEDEDEEEEEGALSSGEELVYDENFAYVAAPIQITRLASTMPSPIVAHKPKNITMGLKTCQESYGFNLVDPNLKDMQMYKDVSSGPKIREMYEKSKTMNKRSLRKLGECVLLDTLMVNKITSINSIYEVTLEPVSNHKLDMFAKFLVEEEEDDILEETYTYPPIKLFNFQSKFLNGSCLSYSINKCSTKIKAKKKEDVKKDLIRKPPTIVVGNEEINPPNNGPAKDYVIHQERLYFCDICFHLFTCQSIFRKHTSVPCKVNRRPPGKKIYSCKSKNFSIWKINKSDEQACEDLCLFGTYFLTSKTSVYTTNQFDLFAAYIKKSDGNYSFAGYYSKMPEQPQHVLSCIIVMPFCRGKGVGSMLVDFAYQMDKYPIMNFGSPEEPLSKEGLFLFLKYWKIKIAEYILKHRKKKVLRNKRKLNLFALVGPISKSTGINAKDVRKTLFSIGDQFKQQTSFPPNHISISLSYFKNIYQKYIQTDFYCTKRHIKDLKPIKNTTGTQKAIRKRRGTASEAKKKVSGRITRETTKRKLQSKTPKELSPISTTSSIMSATVESKSIKKSKIERHLISDSDSEISDFGNELSGCSTPTKLIESFENTTCVPMMNMGGDPDDEMDDQNALTITEIEGTILSHKPMSSSPLEGPPSLKLALILSEDDSSGDAPPKLTPNNINDTIDNENSQEYLSPPPLLTEAPPLINEITNFGSSLLLDDHHANKSSYSRMDNRKLSMENGNTSKDKLCLPTSKSPARMFTPDEECNYSEKESVNMMNPPSYPVIECNSFVNPQPSQLNLPPQIIPQSNLQPQLNPINMTPQINLQTQINPEMIMAPQINTQMNNHPPQLSNHLPPLSSHPPQLSNHPPQQLNNHPPQLNNQTAQLNLVNSIHNNIQQSPIEALPILNNYMDTTPSHSQIPQLPLSSDKFYPTLPKTLPKKKASAKQKEPSYATKSSTSKQSKKRATPLQANNHNLNNYYQQDPQLSTIPTPINPTNTHNNNPLVPPTPNMNSIPGYMPPLMNQNPASFPNYPLYNQQPFAFSNYNPHYNYNTAAAASRFPSIDVNIPVTNSYPPFTALNAQPSLNYPSFDNYSQFYPTGYPTPIPPMSFYPPAFNFGTPVTAVPNDFYNMNANNTNNIPYSSASAFPRSQDYKFQR